MENLPGMHSRREFLKMSAIVGAAFSLPLDKAAALIDAGVRPFRVPLRVPTILQPVASRADRDIYRTVMRRSTVEIIPGKRTPVWTFDGHFPGPTIKVKKGRTAIVRRVNRLHVPTTIHLHGGHVPPHSDGQPDSPIAPGDRYDYVYPNEQAGATLWYHDHMHHNTSRNNYKGLSGMYIVEDPEEAELNLPKGRYDVPLILQDRSFNPDGTLAFHDHHNSVRGSVLLVNGEPMPYMKVANRKYRFRILNASNSRAYRLALSNGEPLVQIASDGGLLAAPAPQDRIALWPAERAEVVIDFSKYPLGTKIVLVHKRSDPLKEDRVIMRFDVSREETDNSSLPGMLRTIERLVPPGTEERTFDLSFDQNTRRWVINGKAFNPDRIDAQPQKGSVEVWNFRNLSNVTHPMHIHLVQFQVLGRTNLRLSPGELGWKDTVRVDPSSQTRVIMRFDGFTGRYFFHCHNLAHEDHSMMGTFKVVA